MRSLMVLVILGAAAATVFGQQFNSFNRNNPQTNRVNPQQNSRPVAQQQNRNNPQLAKLNEIQPKKSNVTCPDKNGRYPHKDQCDAYIECLDGYGEIKMCPEGLMYNTGASFFSYPCDFPNRVDCSGRPKTQPAEPTEDCPHQYGYFRGSESPSECGEFKICNQGKGYKLQCPEGLAFSSTDYLCDWPDLVQDCDAEAYLRFRCPEFKANTFFGEPEYRFYRSPEDCRRYFLCINNRPRMFNCGSEEAYNEDIQGCDGIENVTSCAGSFKSPETYQTTNRVPNNYRG